MKSYSSEHGLSQPRPQSSITITNAATPSRSRHELTIKFTRKTDLFAGVYRGNSITEGSQPKNHSHPTQPIISLPSKRVKEGQPASSQQRKAELQAQNQKMRAQVGKLQQQVSTLKSLLARQTQTPALDINYFDEAYWSGEVSHRVQGMRQQYDKVVAECQGLRSELSERKRGSVGMGVREMEIYCKELQAENHRLRQMAQAGVKCAKCMEEIRWRQSQAEAERARKKAEAANSEISQLKSTIRKLQASLHFMESSLRRRSNNRQAKLTLIRKTERKCEYLEKQIDQLTQYANRQNLVNQLQKQQLQLQLQQDFNQAQKQWKRIVLQKDRRISELETLCEGLEKSVLKVRSNVNTRRLSVDLANMNLLAMELGRKYTTNSQDTLFIENGPRQQLKVKLARNTNRNTQKNQGIKYDHVQPIGQLLRYRMIAHNIDHCLIPQFFTFNPAREVSPAADLASVQSQWQDSYICLAQVESILQRHPFGLSECQSRTLARYAVQVHQVHYDSQVYNRRAMVKSVIKAVIGEYSDYGEQERQQLEQFIAQFRNSMVTVLDKYCSSRRVSQGRLADLLKVMGVDMTDRMFGLLLAKASLHCDSMGELDYGFLKAAWL